MMAAVAASALVLAIWAAWFDPVRRWQRAVFDDENGTRRWEAVGAMANGKAGVDEGRRLVDATPDPRDDLLDDAKQVAVVFGAAWNGRKYSIKSATALRAFIRVAPDVIQRLDQEHAERTDFRAIGRVIAPWGRRIGNMRFETEAAWKGSGTTVESLAKELRLALQYPEGAAV